MRLKWIWLVLGLVFAYGLYQLYLNLELREESTDAGPIAAAQRNPFFAAQRYLQQSGRTVGAGAELERLQSIPAQGTIIIDDSLHVLSEARADALLAWVQRGGRLIVGLQVEPSQTDWLLERFEIEKYNTDYKRDKKAEGDNGDSDDKEDDATPTKKLSELLREANKELKTQTQKQQAEHKPKSARERRYPDAEITQLHIKGSARSYTIHFTPYTALDQPHIGSEPDDTSESPHPLYWNGSSVGAQFVQFELGRGTLTVLSDINIWNSQRIGEYDHAALLDLLSAPKAPAYILYGAQVPALTTLIWRNARELMLAGALWLCAWLVYRARRFGPTREQAQPARRSLAEHIQAGAAYLWQRGASTELLNGARAAVQRRAQQVLPGYAALGEPQQFDRLSAHTGIARDKIEIALRGEPGTEPDALRNLVITLQNIGKKL